ncbi:uncharacterized protein LOC131618551 [Vicia villosa]|uniref:uncharacterized protein LOC131618551 n=1 Tax=Vicia villosa TaxID=3911 RepID=UPI00273CC17C|nr:uncharacterized protein LOC131618551 [Vicia villosa]
MSPMRGRPRKMAAAQTPPMSVRLFSSASSSHGKTINTQLVVPDEVLEAVIEEDNEENVKDKTKTPRPWVDVTRDNRLPQNGLNIEYTPPTIVNGELEVIINEQDIQSEIKYWENSLIMYVLEGELTMNAVKGFMMNVWNFVTLPDLYYNEECYFIIRTESKTDKDAILMRGPYTIFRKPMFLHEWKANFKFKEDVIRTVPIWVMLHQLPLVYWGENSIGKIASFLGRPITTDECTAKKKRVSYARILIEIDITTELKESITIRDPRGNKFSQPVEYEWKPLFCKSCGKVGHNCEQKKDRGKQKKIWHAKQKQDNPLEPVVKPTEVTTEDIETTEESSIPWTTVGHTSRTKGKGATYDDGTMPQPRVNHVGCSNIFEVLGDGTEHGKFPP